MNVIPFTERFDLRFTKHFFYLKKIMISAEKGDVFGRMSAISCKGYFMFKLKKVF
jgi:hypothetical protein